MIDTLAAARTPPALRTWLTFDGAIKTTVVMTKAETEQLGELLGKATVAR